MAEDKNTNQSLIDDLKAELDREQVKLYQDPTDVVAKENVKRIKSALKRYGVDANKDDSNSKMKDGGMAQGRGPARKHMYATGGQVVDHLSKVVGPPQSVQAATATVGESPAERSKRLRSGG